MNILAFETVGEDLNIALSVNGKQDSLSLRVGVKASCYIIDKIDELLKRNKTDINQINTIIVPKGPGSFTGLRISLSVAKGFAFAINADIKMVPTMQMYLNSYNDGKSSGIPVLVVIDAKKSCWYSQGFLDNKEIITLGDRSISEIGLTIENLLKKYGETKVVGVDSGYLKELLLKEGYNLNKALFVSDVVKNPALSLLTFANINSAIDSEGLEYIRKSDAEVALESKEQK